MVKIEVSKTLDDRLILKFPYDPNIIKKVKSISGRWWHKDEKYWTIPNTKEAITQLKLNFHMNDLNVEKSLKSSFLEVSKKGSSNGKKMFVEVFPINPEIIPKLIAYKLSVKESKSPKIGGKFSYQLRNHFGGHWIWSNYRIITDSPQNTEQLQEVLETLWSNQPDIYKDLIGIQIDETWTLTSSDLSKFVAYGLIEDSQPIINQILKNKVHFVNNARIDRVFEIRPWVVNKRPAISISISSNLIYIEDLKMYSKTLTNIDNLIGLWVSDKNSTLKGEIQAIIGILRDHKNRLLRLASKKSSLEIIEQAADDEYIVSVKVSTSSENYDYVISALNIILRMEDFPQFNIDGSKAQNVLHIEPEIRFSIIKEISELFINKGIITDTYDSASYPENFLIAGDINFKPRLKFGNNKSFDYEEKTVLRHLKDSGLYKISEEFKSDKIVNVGILSCLKSVSLESFCKKLQQEMNQLDFKINFVGKQLIDEISRLNLEYAVENIIEKKPNILLIFIPDEDVEDSEDWSIYHHIKSITISKDIANQVVYSSTIDNQYAMGNIILGILGKTGNIPFILADPLPYTDYVVGIDIAHAKKKKLAGTINATAITRIYLSDGEFLHYTIYDAPIEGETIPDNVLKSLFPATEFRDKRVVIHRDGYFRGKEKETLKEWAKKINAEFCFVEIIKTGTPRLYLKQNGQIISPIKGTAFILDNKNAFLVSSLPAFKSGTPQPLRVITETPFTIENAIHSILSLTLLHYGSLRAPKLPVTIHYSDRIAYLALRGIKPKNMEGKIPFWL